jgi:class 3 adenylate cyclase/tetratricopeptide (TPR) repeat protein
VRCAACGDLNPDSARFCGSCGKRLGAAVPCSTCGEANPQGQSFCHACGAQQSAARSAPGALEARLPEGERKQVTVLFADVAGSMELASGMDPEEWGGLMERFFAILRAGVNRFDGRIDKFTGDGVMALFGAPVAYEDHARRACAAALALRDELARFSADLERERSIRFAVRMGLNSGEVVAGAVGEDLKVEYTAVGNTVGLAQRMESLAKAGRVCLTAATAALVEGYFEIQPLGPLTVKGVEKPMPVFELAGHGVARTPLEVAAAKGFSRFVGREREMALLDGAFVDTANGEGQVIGVVAEPGVGKSRLCHEFAERCRAGGFEVFVAHGLAHARSVPFVPVLEVLRSQFGIGEGDDPAAARAKVYGAVRDLDSSTEESLPLLFDFLGVADPDHPAPAMDADARQRQIFAVLNRLRGARSARAPFVVLVEDLHWLDPASEAFLENLVDSVPGTRQLVVTTFRPEYRAPWEHRSHYGQLPLLPLREEARDELLADLLGPHPSLDGVAELVGQRTGGNPFFIEEVIQGLVEEGKLAGRRGAYELAGTIEEVHIPPTVQAVLSARIDRLAPSEKRLVQTAAVVGRQFSRPVVGRVSGLSESDLTAALRTLVDAELVYQAAAYPEEEYTFKHALTEEVAYGSQLAKQRVRTHAAVARTLAEVDPDKLDERASLIAHHHEASGQLMEAAQWNARAAAWAGITQPVEAARLWRRVQRLTDRLDEEPQAAELGFNARLALLGFYWRLGAAAEDGTVPFEEQAAVDFAHAIAFAEPSGQPALVVTVLTIYAFVLVCAGAVEEGFEQMSRAIRLADETSDLNLQVVARTPAPYTLYLLGRFRDGVSLSDELVGLTEENRRRAAGVMITSPYADSRQLRIYMRAMFSHIDEELAAMEPAIETCVEEGEWEAEVMAHRGYALTADLAGTEPDASLGHARKAVALADKAGGPFLQVEAREGLAVSHAQRAEWQAAISTADEALEIFRSRRLPVPQAAMLLATRARAQIGQGNLRSAQADATEAISVAVRCGARYYEALARLELARAILAEPLPGEAEVAAAELEQAQSIVETLGIRALAPRIHRARADLAETLGDTDAAIAALHTAHRLFIEIGAHGRAQEAAAALEPRMARFSNG